MLLPHTEGYNYVNRWTGEIYNNSDVAEDEVDDWISCTNENIEKWERSNNLYITINSENIYNVNNIDGYEGISEIIYNYRSENKNKNLDDPVTVDELLEIINNDALIIPTDTGEYKQEYDEEKYDFAQLMTDADCTEYQENFELLNFLNDALPSIQSDYTIYYNSQNQSGTEIPIPDNSNYPTFNGLYEDYFTFKDKS